MLGKHKNKMQVEAILKLSAELNKKSGDNIVHSLGSKNSILQIPRWSTGIPELDSVLGGGMPKGRTIEIYGAESAGKTSLAYHLCARHPLCLYIPIEGTFDEERAMLFGNKPKQMLVGKRVKYGEMAFSYAIRYAELGIPLIVIDSVPSMQPKEDIEKVLTAVHANKETELRLGGVARLMDKYLPTLEDIIEQTDTTVIFINQIRDTMNALPFGDNVHTPGGHKLKHSKSISIQVARKGWIDIPNYNPNNSSTKEKIGLVMKCKIVKNKTAPPQGECEIPLFFNKGFVNFAEKDEVRQEIMKEQKEKYKL